jgi:hypothetical protein
LESVPQTQSDGHGKRLLTSRILYTLFDLLVNLIILMRPITVRFWVNVDGFGRYGTLEADFDDP